MRQLNLAMRKPGLFAKRPDLKLKLELMERRRKRREHIEAQKSPLPEEGEALSQETPFPFGA